MKTIITVILLVFTIIIGLTAIDTGKAYVDKQLGIVSENNSTLSASNSEENKVMVNVTIHGEVQSSGTYEVESGSFLETVIQQAGGITTMADVDCFDYYYSIEDDITIYIAPITEEKKVSINYGTLEEFMTLTGIGKTLGDRIIAYRDEIKTFDYLEEIMNVEGIGKSIFNKIKDKICL